MTTSAHASRPAVTPHYPDQRASSESPETPEATVTRPLVFVSVGTDHHPFERMVRWVDAWSRRRTDIEVVIQHGEAAGPSHATARAYLAHSELVHHIAQASVVVSHGGPATIAEAWRAGLIPLVMPRSHALGEHVDDHQQAFATVLADREQVVRIGSEDELFAALDRALAEPEWLRRPFARHVDVEQSIHNFSVVVSDLIAADRGTHRAQARVARRRA